MIRTIKKIWSPGKRALPAAILCMTISIMGVMSCHNPNNYIIPPTPTGNFYLDLHTYIDTSEADSTAPYFYFDSLGRYISLQVPQFFLSGISFMNANGNTFNIGATRIIKDLDTLNYLAGTVPAATYNSVLFYVGLDATANAEPPATFTPTGYVPTDSMYYNGSIGYMAMKIEGLYDTTSTPGHIGSGLNPIHFSFEIPNAMIGGVLITMPTRGTGAWSNYPLYNLPSNGTQTIHLICDYGKLLSVLNLKTQNYTDGITTRIGIADTLALQIPNMFRYKQ